MDLTLCNVHGCVRKMPVTRSACSLGPCSLGAQPPCCTEERPTWRSSRTTNPHPSQAPAPTSQATRLSHLQVLPSGATPAGAVGSRDQPPQMSPAQRGESKNVLVIQSCPPLCNPIDCSLPDSPVHGILRARILEWVAISFSRRSS